MKAVTAIEQGIDQLIGKEDLEKKLQSGKPLKVKLGVDPTRPDLTLGHAVVFQKLRQFQDLGHTAQLVIGDFTTRVGDPSGRSSTRPQLEEKEIEENATTYLEQAFRVLDHSKTEVFRNSEWFGKMSFADVLKLSSKMTVARMLERDDFAKRYASNTPISIVEFLYPLMQGHDSVILKSDVELGGRDQLFNMLVGRQLQKEAGMEEQAVICMPLLVGLDGVNKMSKSLNNYVAFNDSPKDMFGKIMSVSDELMWDYYRLVLQLPEQEIKARQTEHPMEMKKELARLITARFYSEEDGQRERAAFEQVFSKGQLPDEMPEFKWDALAEADEFSLPALLSKTGLFPSNKEIRRLLQQGAVKKDGEKLSGEATKMINRPTEPVVFQSGKRLFFKILP
ncbi:MAG: tyrosine--tRNA ligase [Opitutales bacterium]|nr:tyrosine--tRNA ligase [Opitutales bacterium]